MAIPEQLKYYSSFGSFWLANVRVAEVSRGVFYKKFAFHYTLCDNIFDQNTAFVNMYNNQFIYLHIFVAFFEINASPCIFYRCRLLGEVHVSIDYSEHVTFLRAHHIGSHANVWNLFTLCHKDLSRAAIID